MRHGSLESGIGGFDFAAEAMGWENVFHVEINPFCRTVLKYYWPHAKSYSDVFEFDGRPWRGKIDILTCGFPCQPFSNAGQRKGSQDDRFLWPENMRVVREAQPLVVVAENVTGLLTIEKGLVFEQVCTDLENEGYEVTPVIIPACATDKNHRRDRVWIIAYNSCYGERRLSVQQRDKGQKSFDANGEIETSYATYSSSQGLEKRESFPDYYGEECQAIERGITDAYNASGRRRRKNNRERAPRFRYKANTGESWLEAATSLCRVDDGLSGRLDTEAISKSKWRTESLKAYGNAIVWEVAFEIFKAIEASFFSELYN